MKHLLTFEKVFESILDYRLILDTKNEIKYRFISNNIKYFVTIYHDNRVHNFGEYEVEFGDINQKSPSDRTGLDISHLHNVLDTVCDIVENVVKKYKIPTIKLDGALDEKDDNTFLLGSNIRSKVYTRFLSRRYGSDSIYVTGRFIKVDMKKIFPDIFKNNELSKVDLIVNELVRISDEYPSEEEIRGCVDGSSDNHFNISTDSIINSKFGSLYVEISVWDDANEYSISWDKIDEGDEGFEGFNNFDSLLQYLKIFK